MDEKKPFRKIEIDSEIGRRFLKTIIKEKTVIIFVLAFKGTNPFLMDKNSKKNSKMPPSDKTIEGIKRCGSSCSQNLFQSKRD